MWIDVKSMNEEFEYLANRGRCDLEWIETSFTNLRKMTRRDYQVS